MKAIVVIPTHNHYERLPDILGVLTKHQLPVIIIDDGSSAETAENIQTLHNAKNKVEVIRIEENGGKGVAVLTGIRWAQENGYSHAIQIDADGQHDLDSLNALIRAAEETPTALVTGVPQYDDSIPTGRKIGRWITHVWVWIETLSTEIKDSMCGFRIYPIDQTIAIADKETVGDRMDFDTEIMVRLYWLGVPVRQIPVRVTYPPDNHSNFDVLADNVRISAMHTRLFFGMLLRLPRLLKKENTSETPSTKATHWSNLGERGAYAGLVITAWVLRLCGLRVCRCFAAIVATYFWATHYERRKASKAYLGRVLKRQPSSMETLRHFLSFSDRSVETFAGWLGHYPSLTFDFENAELQKQLLAEPRGLILVVSHFGNTDILRAGMSDELRKRITVLVHTKHAKHFNRLIAEYRPDANVNVLQVTDVGPDTLIDLAARIERGEWIAIAGDRTPVDDNNRVERLSFLGDDAAFPQGPFLLAGLLKCPVYSLFCIKDPEGDRHAVFMNLLAEAVDLPRCRNAMEGSLREPMQRYAESLEAHCLKRPYLWYNFFSFWEP